VGVAVAETAEKLDLTYHGGISEAGRIHFYEYSRASYAFARLLSTAEHFRRTGMVAEKIGSKSYVDLIVEAPRRGSFITEVIVPVVASTLPELANVSVRAMVAYIFHLLNPRSEETDESVIELAKIRRVEIRRQGQAGDPVAAARLLALENIVESQTATTRQALELVRYALLASNVAVHRLHPDPKTYREMERELEAELEQEKEIKKVESRLA
jgi:hypothetical protein